MDNGNENVNYYLAFVLYLRIIKTAEIQKKFTSCVTIISYNTM